LGRHFAVLAVRNSHVYAILCQRNVQRVAVEAPVGNDALRQPPRPAFDNALLGLFDLVLASSARRRARCRADP
jgi:hypothetical protein